MRADCSSEFEDRSRGFDSVPKGAGSKYRVAPHPDPLAALRGEGNEIPASSPLLAGERIHVRWRLIVQLPESLPANRTLDTAAGNL
jgi:hypothetical protein